MDPSTDLALNLTLLSEALDEPDTNVAGLVSVFADTARQAVGSYLGLSISARATAGTTVIIVPPRPWPSGPRASVRLALPTSVTPPPPPATILTGAGPAAPPSGGSPVVITLYAEKPGAFVDLAADLAYLFTIPLGDIAVDQQLPGPAHCAAPSGPGDAVTVREMSTINQAIGVLIDQGHHPDDAHPALARTAADVGITLTAAATIIITAAQH